MEYTTEIRCPRCNSSQLTSNAKGFSAGKAIGGAILTGGIGLLAGFLGSKKVLITCLACGSQFRAGEGKVVQIPIETAINSVPKQNQVLSDKPKRSQLEPVTNEYLRDDAVDEKIIEIAKTESYSKAILYYSKTSHINL